MPWEEPATSELQRKRGTRRASTGKSHFGKKYSRGTASMLTARSGEFSGQKVELRTC